MQLERPWDRKAPNASQVNAILKAAYLFFKHATLRRELINQRMSRLSDCTD
jgi:hypothetical protein